MDSQKTGDATLENFPVHVRMKLAVLWTSITLCYLYGDYFELYVPGKAAGLISGDNLLHTPARLFAAAVLLAIPALLVYLSLVVKAQVAKWLNICFGVVFTCIMALIAISSLEPWRAFYAFLAVVEALLSSLVVWHAWKWPRL